MRIDMSNGAIETIPNEKVLASIGDHIDNPIPDPPTPKLAATVMLVRDSKPSQTKYRIDDGVFPPDFPNNQNVEVFMLRRVNTDGLLTRCGSVSWRSCGRTRFEPRSALVRSQPEGLG